MKFLKLRMFVLGLCLALMPAMAVAGPDFDDYKTANDTTGDITLPTVTAGYFVAGDFFPDGTTAMIDGTIEAEGRMIVAMGTQLLIQRTYGSGVWDVVATVPTTMDPCFVRPSPSGNMIALGRGYGQPLLIFPTAVLSASNPPDLTTAAGVVAFTSEYLSYYDGDWKNNLGDANDDRYFIIDGGAWPGPECTYPYWEDDDCVFESGVGAVDTQSGDPANDTGVLLLEKDGASADVDVDGAGNLIAGVGYGTNTGELRIRQAGQWDPTSPNNIDFNNDMNLLADNLLSGAYMGQDAEGNFHVGGGDAFGTGGPAENGYAAIIEAGVVGGVADGSRGPVIDGNRSDNAEYKYFQDDPYGDDSATGIVANTWARCTGVIWNPTGTGSVGSAADYWGPGVTPIMTYHCPGSAGDDDADGIPNALDNAYLTDNPGQDDTDGDGYGNVADADLDNDNTVGITDAGQFRTAYGTSDPDADFDGDGSVGVTDSGTFRTRYGENAPYY